MEILKSRAVAAHIQRIEVVDIDVLAAIKRFARPELSFRLALQDLADLNEGFTQAELIVTGTTWKTCITGGVCGVGLNHELCLHPLLIRSLIWVQPVVDEDQFRIGLRFIS